MNGEIIIHAMFQNVICPFCEGENTGFVMDPRGAENIVCEQCEEKFDIPGDARVVMD